MQNSVYLRVRRHDKANQKLLIRGSMDARKRERELKEGVRGRIHKLQQLAGCRPLVAKGCLEGIKHEGQ